VAKFFYGYELVFVLLVQLFDFGNQVAAVAFAFACELLDFFWVDVDACHFGLVCWLDNR
jgi:hypothetical protein